MQRRDFKNLKYSVEDVLREEVHSKLNCLGMVFWNFSVGIVKILEIVSLLVLILFAREV